MRRDDHAAILQLMVEHSGKFVLLKKMLDKLREEGRRVLLFSQMTRLLDLVEDAMRHWQFTFERIDGGITGNARQAAIDRFCRPNSDRFVFLLSTKAGGLGLNLQVADTIIIFDSDWNPQNDLQAIARSHRIGQTREVQVYRLIARKTYENEMFERASRKLGLGHAIMGTMQASPFAQPNDEAAEKLNKAELELMLRKGYYHQVDDATLESTQLNEDTIDQILHRDAKVIEYRSTSAAADGELKEAAGSASNDRARGSNRFAKASFVTAESEEVGDWSDADFWKRMFPDASTEVTDGLLDETILTGKRKRRMLHGSYQHLLHGPDRGGKRQRAESPAVDEDDEYHADSQQQSDDDSVVSDEPAPSKGRSQRPVSEVCKRASLIPHGLQSLLEQSLCRFGYGRWPEIRRDMQQQAHQKMVAAADKANKEPSLGTAQLNEASAITALLEKVSIEDIRSYVVGWLKMCYLYTKHKALYASDSEGDSDDDRASRKKLRKKFRDNGSELDLHQSSQLAEDARQLIEEERARKRQAKKEAEKQKALAAIEAVSQTMADIARIKSPPPSTISQTATVKAEASTNGIKHDTLNTPAVKAEARTKQEHSTGVKPENGHAKTEEKAEDEESEDEEEEELAGLSFLQLLQLLPVDSTLLTPHQEKHLKSAGANFISVLQSLHTLNWYVVLEDNVFLSHPPHDAAKLQTELNTGQKSKSARLQWLQQHLNGWWKADDDWWLLLGLRLHGLDEFDAVRDDHRLPFATRLGKQETLSFDNTQSDEYKRLFDRFQFLYDTKAPKVQVDTAQQLVRQAETRQETLAVVWPTTGNLVAYSRKLIGAARRVRKKTAEKRAKEHERKRRQQEEEAEEQRQREKERARMEEEAKAEEATRKRKKEKKADKEKAKESELADKQRVRNGKSKADKSLEQMLVKRQAGQPTAVVVPEDDIAADESDAGPNKKHRKSQKGKHDRHKAAKASGAASPRHSSSSSSSKSKQPTLNVFFTSPSQRMKPLPLINVDASSPSIVSTASPASSSSPSASHSTRSPMPAPTLAVRSKQAARVVPDLFKASRRSDSVGVARHAGSGVRRLEWRDDGGRDEGDVELSMGDDDDEELEKQQKHERKHKHKQPAQTRPSPLPSLTQSRPSVTAKLSSSSRHSVAAERVSRDEVIILDDEDDD